MRLFDDLDVVCCQSRIDLPADDERSKVVCPEPVNLRLAVSVQHERTVETNVERPLAIASQTSTAVAEDDGDFRGQIVVAASVICADGAEVEAALIGAQER